MKRTLAVLLWFLLSLPAVPVLAHLAGKITASTEVAKVKRAASYVYVWGRSTITSKESGGGVALPGRCEIVARVRGAGTGETYVKEPGPGQTVVRRWKIQIPDLDGDSSRRARARVAHCH